MIAIKSIPFEILEQIKQYQEEEDVYPFPDYHYIIKIEVKNEKEN